MSITLQGGRLFTLLLDRKPSDNPAASSVVEFLGPLIIELGMRVNIRFAPDATEWNVQDYDLWALEAMDECDAAIIVDPRLHGALRRAGWDGPCILNPMGGLAHGAGLTRAYARHATTRDRIWYVGEADVGLHQALFDSDSDCPAVLDLPYPCDTDAYRPQLGPRNSSPTARLVYAGRLMADKNVHSLLYVLRHLLSRGLDCKLILAGSFDDTEIPSRSQYASDFEEYFWGLAAYLELEDRVVFAGRLSAPALAQLYASADVYVNPTFAVGDNFGLSRVQAQMVGLPVVTAAWAGATSYRSEIQYDVPTFMTRSGPRFSTVTFADTVADVLQEAPRLDEESAERFSRRFDAGSIADAMLNVLNDLTQEPLAKLKPTSSALLRLVEEAAPVRNDEQIPNLRGLSYQDLVLRMFHAYYTTYSLADDCIDVKQPPAGVQLELVPALAPVDGNVASLDPLYRIASNSRTVMELIETYSQGEVISGTASPGKFREEMSLGYLLPILRSKGHHDR